MSDSFLRMPTNGPREYLQKMRQPPEQTPPLLFGPDNVTEGYYELETLERGFTLQALGVHQAAVALWYRALTLYWRGMRGEWNFSDVGEDTLGLTVYGLQSQLLGLGVSSAKAALDTLLAGYYSASFASIRHMLETYVQYLYVAVEPEAARNWYHQAGEAENQHKTPGCRLMVDHVKKRQDLVPADFLEAVYEAWSLMSKGTHPTGAGIFQTVNDATGERFVIGATYSRDFCLTGFDHGLFAIVNLLTALIGLRQQSEQWEAALSVLQSDISKWRRSTANALLTTDEDLTSEAARGI